jgi:hypothetical protein
MYQHAMVLQAEKILAMQVTQTILKQTLAVIGLAS